MNKTYIATMGERFFMSKIAIATDSNSGITQAQGRELGIFVMPMPFYINDELFLEDITLSQEQFYQRLEEGADVKTTQPAPGDVLELWERILKDYDELVYIPMSSGLSSSCETAVMLAQDYSGRVQVVNNQRISVTLRQSALDAQALAAARDWGCRLLVVHTGFIPWVYYPEWFVEKSVEFWREFLPQVPEGMVLCLENVMEPSPQIPVDIIRQVDDPRLRLCLDVGHANAELSRTPVMEWVEVCRPYLRHLHLHNNAGGGDLHDPLKRGTIPVEQVLHALSREEHLTYTLETLQAEENVRWLLEKGFLTL